MGREEEHVGFSEVGSRSVLETSGKGPHVQHSRKKNPD